MCESGELITEEVVDEGDNDWGRKLIGSKIVLDEGDNDSGRKLGGSKIVLDDKEAGFARAAYKSP